MGAFLRFVGKRVYPETSYRNNSAAARSLQVRAGLVTLWCAITGVIAMAKHFASEVAEKVASLALELFGGYGFIKEFPAEKFYRDAKIGKIYEGTSNMQLQTIAKMCMNR